MTGQDSGIAEGDQTDGVMPSEEVINMMTKAMFSEIEHYLSQQSHPRTAVMDEHQAAEYIGCSVSWLRNKRRSSVTPPFAKVGKNIRYRITDLDQWLEQQVVKH